MILLTALAYLSLYERLKLASDDHQVRVYVGILSDEGLWVMMLKVLALMLNHEIRLKQVFD